MAMAIRSGALVEPESDRFIVRDRIDGHARQQGMT